MMDAIFGGAAALLSGLGLGSGGLLVIYLTIFGEYQQLTAQGINLLFFLFSSGSAMVYHFFHRKINYGVVLTLIWSGMIGALLGTFLSGVLSGGLVRKIFGVVLVISGMLVLKKSFVKRGKKQKSRFF